MDKKINKSELIGMFRRESLMQTDMIAINTWDGLMELVVLVPLKHFKDYIDQLNDCYDDNLDPVVGAPANTPSIIDACPFPVSKKRRKVVAEA